MTILRPGKKRRDPLGVHKCFHCDCEFEVSLNDQLPKEDTLGDIWGRCPACQGFVHLNKLVSREESK